MRRSSTPYDGLHKTTSVGVPLADHVDHSVGGMRGAILGPLLPSMPYDGILVQFGWPYLLLITLTLPCVWDAQLPGGVPAAEYDTT